MSFYIVSALAFIFQISASKGAVIDQYIGCFSSSLNFTSDLDTEQCVEFCQTNTSDSYAAIQNGEKCLCLNNPGKQIADENCTSIPYNNEIDNSTYDRQNSYALYTVCPIGRHGTSCYKSCHCKDDAPCNRETGKCPTGCHHMWTGDTCEKAQIRYVGCYGDDDIKSPDLFQCRVCDKAKNSPIKMTPKLCTRECLDQKFTYAGIQFGWACFCGHSYDRFKRNEKNETECNSTCTGDQTQICGGESRKSVFTVCPPGFHGDSCTLKCHCESSNHTCFQRNGSCPASKCRPGWTGKQRQCNLRDCDVNNGDCGINEQCLKIQLHSVPMNVCRCSEGFHRKEFWGMCQVADEINSYGQVSAAVVTKGLLIVFICIAAIAIIAVASCASIRFRGRRRKSNHQIENDYDYYSPTETTNGTATFPAAGAETILVDCDLYESSYTACRPSEEDVYSLQKCSM